MKNYDTIWDEIYSKGMQLNKYPYSSIVSFIFNHLAKTENSYGSDLLEIGCGAGNNLWFAAREGLKVTGIDASSDALKFARNRFKDENLKGNFDLGDFTELPYRNNSFDIVIERAALSQAPKKSAKSAVREISRVLKSEGIFYAEIYSDRATTRGTKTDGGLLIDTEGPYSGVGQIGFYSKSEIEMLFIDEMEIIKLSHTETQDATSGPIEVQAHWSIVAKPRR